MFHPEMFQSKTIFISSSKLDLPIQFLSHPHLDDSQINYHDTIQVYLRWPTFKSRDRKESKHRLGDVIEMKAMLRP